MRKEKRFKSEREILAAIHQCHRDAQAAIVRAESLETIAKEYARMGMADDATFKREEAAKLRRSADRLIDSKAKKLGDCLSEYKTTALPFLADTTVKAI